MLTKIHIKINHIWTQISYSSPYEAHLIKTIKGLLLSKRRKTEIAKGHFKKSQKLLADNLHERPPIQNIQLLFIQFKRRVM